MFSIGEFARHGRVSVRMLRHYDAIGLIRPACVDPVSATPDSGCSSPSKSPRPEDKKMSAPEIVTRAAQPYVAIRTRLTMAEPDMSKWVTQFAFRLAGQERLLTTHKSGPDNLCWPTISAGFRGAGCRRSQRTSAKLVAAVVESEAADTEHIHHGMRCGPRILVAIHL